MKHECATPGLSRQNGQFHLALACALLAFGLLAVALLSAACGESASAATELRFEWRSGEGFAGQVSIHQAFAGQP